MAAIRKQGDSWRADVKKRGFRKSASFSTKAAAKEWATRMEADIMAERAGQYPRHTFREALERYANEISVGKQGAGVEMARINALIGSFPELVNKQFSEVKSDDIARWRDVRLAQVSKGTVSREFAMYGHVFTIGRKEWHWCGESPFSDVERPSTPPSRERRVSPSEVKRICRQLGYVTGRIQTKSQEVALAFLISLRTAMRAGEILSLNASRINLKDRVLTVPHKTQYITGKARQIPITKKAARLIGYLSGPKYFTVSSVSRSHLFRQACLAQGIEDLHFHDARAEALTRLSRKVDVMTLAKISGHRDLGILQNTYYRETAKDIAARLS